MKRFRMLLCLMLVLALTSCTVDAPVFPPRSLPAVEKDDAAPIGDAGLRHQSTCVMYLPAVDGQHLLSFYQTLTLSHEQHPAETILRVLFSHRGNDRVRPIGRSITLALFGSNPVEVSGGNCTVNLSASALQLSQQDLHTAALSIAATLCELDDIDHVSLLVAGTPVAMDVTGTLPLGSLTAQLGQELPVLWEQLAARRTPVGESPAETPLTSTATLYHPLASGGIVASTRRLSFTGQTPAQLTMALLDALSSGANLPNGAADLPDLTALLRVSPTESELSSGGKRITLHFVGDVRDRLSRAGCEPASSFAAIVYTLTSFIPSLQQVCILVGDNALTSLFTEELGSMLFTGGLHERADYAHALRAQSTLYIPQGDVLAPRTVSLPYRNAVSPRAVLLHLGQLALPDTLTDADILGLSVTDDTLRINLSSRYAEVIRQSEADQRLMAYAMVNTLCEMVGTRRVRFAFGSETVDHLGQDMLWSGEFLYHPNLISP